jgi:hypothetical protein
MTHARARLALLALGFACAVAITIPAQASAVLSFYNCVSQTAYVWCDGRANSTYDGENSWDWNEVWDPDPVGTLRVCQRVFKPSTGVFLAGDSCANDSSANDYGNVTCVCYDAQITHEGAGLRAVNGFADSAW